MRFFRAALALTCTHPLEVKANPSNCCAKNSTMSVRSASPCTRISSPRASCADTIMYPTNALEKTGGGAITQPNRESYASGVRKNIIVLPYVVVQVEINVREQISSKTYDANHLRCLPASFKACFSIRECMYVSIYVCMACMTSPLSDKFKICMYIPQTVTEWGLDMVGSNEWG